MKKRASKFKQAVVQSAKEQKAQGSQYGYLNLPQGVNLFKELPDTKVLLDFLPYEVTDKLHPEYEKAQQNDGLWYRRPYKSHRGIGVNNESVVCPTSINKRCPICEYRAKRLKEGAPQEETQPLKTSNRNLYVVVPLGVKNYEEKPHIWDISQFLFQNMLVDEINEDEDRGVFADLEEGLSLKIRFGEATIGKGKPFAETSRIDFVERDKPYDESILKKVPNLDEVLNIMDYKQLEFKFMEVDEEEEKGSEKTSREKKEEKEEKEEKASGKPMRRTAPPKKEEPEEEDEKDEKKDKKKNKNSDCPFDYEFGKDCEKHDECDNCDEWDKCIDAKEGK